MYQLSDYNYDLPEELIAQSASSPADSCKFLVYDKKTQTTDDQIFSELPSMMVPESLIVFNTTKVVKARIPLEFGTTTGEIFYLELVAWSQYTCNALVRPGKKFHVGSTITIAPWVTCTVDALSSEGRILTFSEPVLPLLERLGQIPLPPYINFDESKQDDYQTIFAKQAGSVAAPTASLHFTDRVLTALSNTWVDQVTCVLHVGLWTFKQVNVEAIQEYVIHSEKAHIPWELFEQIATKKQAKKPVVAVGTTVTRTLESMPYVWKLLTSTQKEHVEASLISRRDHYTEAITTEQAKLYTEKRSVDDTGCMVDTKLYIIPGFQFRMIDQLITNFHLPKSSLLMLVAAFVWYDQMRHLYEHAIRQSYRFYSFGDAMYLR